MSSSVVSKVLVVGDVATGKTSLIRRYVHGWFSTDHKSTIGVDFSLKTIKVDSNVDCHLQMWDIAGQERFTGLARIYYRDAVAAVVVFDLTDRRSLDSAEAWKRDIDDKVFLKNGEQIPVLLIGNKADLVQSGSELEQCASDEAIRSIAREHGFIGFVKTSAKENVGVDDAFASLAEKIVADCKGSEASNAASAAGPQEIAADDPASGAAIVRLRNAPNNAASSGSGNERRDSGLLRDPDQGGSSGCCK